VFYRRFCPNVYIQNLKIEKTKLIFWVFTGLFACDHVSFLFCFVLFPRVSFFFFFNLNFEYSKNQMVSRPIIFFFFLIRDSHGADVNIMNGTGYTALFIASNFEPRTFG